MRRGTPLAWLILAALAAGEARAQSVAFGPPVALPVVPPATAPVQVALAPWTAPPALDLFLGEPRADGSGLGAPGAPAPGDGLADIAWCAATDLRYQLSSDLSPLSYGVATLREGQATGLAFARLLDRTDLV